MHLNIPDAPFFMGLGVEVCSFEAGLILISDFIYSIGYQKYADYYGHKKWIHGIITQNQGDYAYYYP